MGVKQQIPSSTNAPKTMQFAKLKGVDYSTSPFEVNPSRAVDMRNIINDDGINHKRPGWTENTDVLRLFVSDQKVLALCQLDKTRYLLAYSQAIVVLYNDDRNPIILKNIDKGATSINFYKAGSKKIVIEYDFGDTKDIDLLTIENDKYEFSKFDYIPTTTISINADSVASTRKSFEEPSLTTNKRINKIISNDKAIRVTVEYAGENKYGVLSKVVFTNRKGQIVMWEDLDIYSQYEHVTAVLLKDEYEISVSMPSTNTPIIFVIEQDEDGKDVEKQITSINLEEDITIYVKEA